MRRNILKAIDSHFHLYKDARAGLMAQGGESRIGFCGTYDETVSILNRNQIVKVIALAVIPIEPMRQAGMKKWPSGLNATQRQELGEELENKIQTRLSTYNEWLCQTAKKDKRIEPGIAADATVDSDYMAAEIQSKINDYQIKVIKIHPAVNSLSPVHKGYFKIFDLAQQNNLVVVSHGGMAGNDIEGTYCSPENFKTVLDNFPNLKFIVAHLAYPHVKDLIELAPKYKNLYTDLSFIINNYPISDKEFHDIIKNFGPHRVLFGSDFPWIDPEKYVQNLLKFNLDKNELDMICWQNAVNLFQLESSV